MKDRVQPTAQDYRRALEQLNVQVSASLLELEQDHDNGDFRALMCAITNISWGLTMWRFNQQGSNIIAIYIDIEYVV